MSSEKDLVNPYGNNSKCRDFFKLLQEGPKTAQQLIDSGIVKHPRRIRELATILNMLDGLRVRAQYKKDVFDLDAVWSINVTALSCPLIQKPGAATVAVQTGPTIPVIPAKIGRYIPHKKFGLALVSVREGNNIFLYGPSGSGKTEMALQLAKADGNRETIRTNFHKDTGEAEVIGEVSLRQEAGVTVTEWHEGDFGRACRLASEGKKILFIADEITASPAETCFRFHRVLELRKDGSREIEIHGELLKIPAGNLTIVATSNTFRLDEHGEFPGVNTMNPAFCRRWTGGCGNSCRRYSGSRCADERKTAGA